MSPIMAMLVFAAAATPAPVPTDIAAQYEDHNFVSAFSTPHERRLLTGWGPRGAEARLPRLRRVAAALQRLAGRVEDVDPGILGTQPITPEAVLRWDLVRVLSFDIDEKKGEAWVRLEVLTLDGRANATLVSRYDELATTDKGPGVDALLSAAGRELLRSVEMHRWFRVEGTWRREGATRHFIAH